MRNFFEMTLAEFLSFSFLVGLVISLLIYFVTK